MSSPAMHKAVVTPGLQPVKQALDKHIQGEIVEAKRIRQQTGCTWTQALILAANKPT